MHAAKIAGAGAGIDQPLEPGDPFPLMAHQTAVAWPGKRDRSRTNCELRVARGDDRGTEVAGEGGKRIHGRRGGGHARAPKLGQPALDDELEELFAARRELVQGALGAVQPPRQLLGAEVQEAVAQEDVLELLKQALKRGEAGAGQGRVGEDISLDAA